MIDHSTHKKNLKTIEIFREVLPENAIESETISAKQNVTEYQAGEILGILQPETVKEVQEVVRIAAQNKIDLYPYSSGKNWGLGSRLPVKDQTVLLDLSRLKRIEIDTQIGSAIIQAGVTQEELADHFQNNNIPYKFPVTGSGKATSIVGNMMDRGASAFFHRRTRLIGLEVITGTSEKLRTGHWHYHDNEKSQLFYKPGLGADLTSAFTQSNLGIVTSMAVKLIPRDTGILLFAETTEDKISAVIDLVKQLKDQELLGEGVLITNKNDPRTTERNAYSYEGRWSIITCFSGEEDLVKLKQTKLKQKLADHCEGVQFVKSNSTQALSHPYQEILRDMYNGIPSDYSLETMAQLSGITLKNDTDVDQNKQFPGMSVALLAVPFSGKKALKIVDCIRRISEELGVQTFYNFATLDDETFEGFFRVYFNRNDSSAIENAQLWNERVHNAMEKELDIYPYRINIKQMNDFVNRQDDPFWQYVRKLKRVFDPENIIAKGRYCPD